MVVEGVNAHPATIKLAVKYEIDMLITKTVNAIVNGKVATLDTVKMLMGREKKAEILMPGIDTSFEIQCFEMLQREEIKE